MARETLPTRVEKGRAVYPTTPARKMWGRGLRKWPRRLLIKRGIGSFADMSAKGKGKPADAVANRSPFLGVGLLVVVMSLSRWGGLVLTYVACL